MEVLVKTRKVGGSIMALLPKNAVEELDIRGNELIKLEVKKLKKDFFGKLKGIGRFSAEDELSTHD
ncbi:MAG: hypothetical protein HYW50_03855 [Candidatus Diapherotrites archaeon]|nr:hypothetical protein [Candidatus Diapherotrites archaeon]